MGRGRWVVPALVALILTGAAGAPAPAHAQSAGERITGYDVTIAVDERGGIVVSETIDYDVGAAERHGIYRDLPVRTRYDDVRPGFDRVYPLEVVSVSDAAGTPVEHVLESAADTTRVRIGDPDRTITGRHTYELAYRVDGVLNGFADHDELFWNAVGAGWEVPVTGARVRVEAPGPLGPVQCFAGPLRSTLPCDAASADGSTATFVQDRLAPFGAFTVVAAIPAGTVAPVEPILDQRWSLARAFSLTPVTVAAGSVLGAAVVAAFSTLAWRTGRDRRFVGSEVDVAFGNVSGEEQRVGPFERHRPPVEFAPPDGIRPGQVGTLIDEVAHPSMSPPPSSTSPCAVSYGSRRCPSRAGGRRPTGSLSASSRLPGSPVAGHLPPTSRRCSAPCSLTGPPCGSHSYATTSPVASSGSRMRSTATWSSGAGSPCAPIGPAADGRPSA